MASNDTKLGIGLSTGMFFHAPKGTALPAYPLEELEAAWVHVGDVSADGISLSMERSTEDLRNWANQIKRTIMTEHSEKIQATVMDTTQEVLKTLLGDENVTSEAATTAHGAVVKATLSGATLPDDEAFLFLMKDGDDSMAVGCTDGQITEMDSITFAPGAAITWTPTITAHGDGWKLIMDNGQKTT